MSGSPTPDSDTIPDSRERLAEISSQLAGRVDTRSCYQCGTCVASCPVAQHTGADIYHPRRFIRAILEGQAQVLLEQPEIWLCTSCHACLEHCPQRVPVSELISELRNLASTLGHAPKDLAAEVETILSTGWSIPPTPTSNARRQRLGLPPIQSHNNGAQLKAIAQSTGLLKLLDRIKQHLQEQEQEGEESKGTTTSERGGRT